MARTGTKSTFIEQDSLALEPPPLCAGGSPDHDPLVCSWYGDRVGAVRAAKISTRSFGIAIDRSRALCFVVVGLPGISLLLTIKCAARPANDSFTACLDVCSMCNMHSKDTLCTAHGRSICEESSCKRLQLLKLICAIRL